MPCRSCTAATNKVVGETANKQQHKKGYQKKTRRDWGLVWWYMVSQNGMFVCLCDLGEHGYRQRIPQQKMCFVIVSLEDPQQRILDGGLKQVKRDMGSKLLQFSVR
jgi:hypothetical protein